MQTQIILAVVGAVIMLVVGASLARAFGIVGAANLIRYRSKIEDPKDAVVMLCALAVGLASGVGLYALAVFSTAFLLLALGVIESFERGVKRFDLSIKAGDETDELRPRIEAILRRYELGYELRSSADDEVGYDVEVPLDANRIGHQRHPSARPRWARLGRVVGEEEQGEMKLMIQPDDGLTPLVQAVKRAKKTIDIVIFRFDRPSSRRRCGRPSPAASSSAR